MLKSNRNIISSDDYVAMIRSGDLSRVESFLQNKVEIRGCDIKIEIRGLIAAIENGHFYIVQLIVNSDPELYMDITKDAGLIYIAAKNRQYEIVRYLMESHGNMRDLFWCPSWADDNGDGGNEFDSDNADSLAAAVDNSDLKMVETLLDCGWNVHWNVWEISLLLDKFGFEKSMPILARMDLSQVKEEDRYDFLADLYEYEFEHDVPIFEWIRNQGWAMPIGDPSRFITCMIENPLPHVFELLLTPDSTGKRWWIYNYDGFDLSELAQDHDPNVPKIIDLFLQNVQSQEEQDVIDRFVKDHPEYEALERSFEP